MTPSWDRHCADFAADHVKKVAGVDVWGLLGGRVRSPREAADLYRRLGVTCLKDAVTKALGEPVRASEAMRDDLVLVMSGSIPALGICRGELIECLDNMLPVDRAECAWPVSPYRA